jgi:hypothetical protein
MKNENELKEQLNSNFLKGFRVGLWVGGISVGFFILLLMYLFPLPR